MRVLHILNELRPSGAETMLRAAAPHWRRQGIRGEILCTGAELGSYAGALSEAGYGIHHLPFHRSAGFLWALWRFFRTRRFDAVHVHTERAAVWYAAMAFATGQGPLVRSIHAVFGFAGGLRLRRAAQRWVMREALGVRMVACGDSVRRTEIERFGNRAEVIPNWFDGAAFRPAEADEREAARGRWGLAGGDFVVATAGNCGLVKNHGAVLEALATLRGEREIVWLHAGEEEPGCPERARAEEAGVSGQVRFLGTVPALPEVLHAADLFLMPSLREGFGIAALEAMAAGVPVALADVDGLRDFRALGGPVYWMTPDAAGIVAAVRHFAAMGAEARRQAGEELSERAHRRYGVAAGAERYGALYRGGGAALAPYPAREGAR